MKLIRHPLRTPIGDLILVSAGACLRGAEFADCAPRMLRHLARHHGAGEIGAGRVPAALRQAFDDYFHGDLSALEALEIVSAGTPFQQRVWSALRAIPPGSTSSYGALAVRLGMSRGAARAVGHANGANPVAVAVPCHRLVGARGDLSGYAGGIERKRWLLAHEGAGSR